MATRFDDWEGDFLAHHGIRGQKWGVRRFQNEDGSLTSAGRKHYGLAEGGSRKESRQFNRQMRKLNRMEKRADVGLQAAKAKRFATKAKIAGAGALGLAAAAAGSHAGTVKDIKGQIAGWKAAYDAADKESSEVLDWLFKHTGENATLGNAHMMRRAERAINDMKNATSQRIALKKISSFDTAPVSTRTKVLAGAAALTGGYAAYAAIRSKLAKSRTTDKGHAKAVAKGQAQLEKMFAQFKGTPYSKLLNEHVQKRVNGELVTAERKRQIEKQARGNSRRG